MSYHDMGPPDPSFYRQTGMGVVNPLIQLQMRLNEIQDVINLLPENKMSIDELADAIQNILDGNTCE